MGRMASQEPLGVLFLTETRDVVSTMPNAVTLKEAQERLPQLLEQLQPGEEFTITQNGKPFALVKKAERISWPCKAGSAAGKIRMAPDFDAPLEDFKEYEPWIVVE